MRIMSGASDWDDLGDRLARIKRLISELDRARAANSHQLEALYRLFRELDVAEASIA
jgi:hypothetical protein